MKTKKTALLVIATRTTDSPVGMVISSANWLVGDDCFDWERISMSNLHVREMRPAEKAARTRMLRKQSIGCDCHGVGLLQCPNTPRASLGRTR